MKKFMLLHFGFEQPTPEAMEAWGKWFESIADKQLDKGGFRCGREISKDGTKDLPWGLESITGYSIIEAEDLDAAENIAQEIRTSRASGSTKLGPKKIWCRLNYRTSDTARIFPQRKIRDPHQAGFEVERQFP